MTGACRLGVPRRRGRNARRALRTAAVGKRATACHSADPVADYPFAEWRRIVAEMKVRSKLTVTEESALLAYLQAAPKTALPTP